MKENKNFRQLHCFIASAFGHLDVDQTYELGIVEALTDFGIVPHRVDRENHNDDIDDKIIELLNTCDICIADLTFSRPSVYYEAGYFKGLGKEVIFTVRSDHFKPTQNDEYGNLRVHFDLQMKNIIAWNAKSGLKEFTDRLKQRVKLIAVPLLERQEEEKKFKDKTTKYKMLSPEEKQKKIFNIAENIFIPHAQIVTPDISTFLQPRDYFALKIERKLVSIFITQSATKAFLKVISGERVIKQNDDHLSNGNSSHLIIISLRNVPTSRLEDIYPNYRIINDQIISLVSSSKIRSYKNKELESYIHVLSGLNNFDEYETRLKMIFDI